MNIIISSRLVSWETISVKSYFNHIYKYFNEKSADPGKIIIT